MTDCIKLGTWNAPVPAVLVVAVTCARMHHPRVPLCADCYQKLTRFGSALEDDVEDPHWPDYGAWWCAVCFHHDIQARRLGVDIEHDVPDLIAVSEPVSL